MKEQVGGGEIFTRVGHAGWNDHRHFGKWVFSELAGNTSTAGLIALAATGRLPDESACGMLDDIAVILTVADPRIYPLKLVRLASSFGDPWPVLQRRLRLWREPLSGRKLLRTLHYGWKKRLKGWIAP